MKLCSSDNFNSLILLYFHKFNSLILFSHKKSSRLPSYIFSFPCLKKSFSSQQKQFNVNYSHTPVLCLLFICTSDPQETKSNKCNQIEVLLLRDIRLKVSTEYCIQA